MKTRDIDVDIFKGKINTFITIKHKPTKSVVARCYPNNRNIKHCFTKLAKELKCKVEEYLKIQ